MSSSPRDFPAWLSIAPCLPLMLSLWSDCCTWTGTRITFGVDEAVKKRARELGPFTIPSVYGKKASAATGSMDELKSSPYTLHPPEIPTNDSPLPVNISANPDPPPLQKSGSHLSVLVLFICHFPNTSHLYCSKQYISHQTVPNLSPFLLDPVYLFNRGAAQKDFPSLMRSQTSNLAHSLFLGRVGG